MAVARGRLSQRTEQMLDEVTRLGLEAVRETRAENRRRGVANVQVDQDGRITIEQADGMHRIAKAPAEAEPDITSRRPR